MRYAEFAEYVWSDRQERYLLVRDTSINWTGPVAETKGASSTQEQLQQSEATFYNTMTQDYNTTFGENQAIMSTLTNALNPIVAAGPNQMGFNGAELNNLNSQALQGTGQSYANASQALKEQQAATGGGNAYLPSGVQSQQQAGLASSAANLESNQLLGIQQAGYQQGYSMYNNAVGGLAGVAGLESPTTYSSAATSAAGAANTEANAVQAANQAGMNDLMGLATGAMGGEGTALSCPVKGSKYLMADDSEKLVEDLRVGELIQGIDGEPETILEIQVGPLPILVVKTDNGFTAKNSTVHAYALPAGGFVTASQCLGKTVRTAKGNGKIISVEKAGVEDIYNVITDGSHTYRADGVWALGQSEGEREVDTATWQRVGRAVKVEEGVCR
jgi:hypothetical protein